MPHSVRENDQDVIDFVLQNDIQNVLFTNVPAASAGRKTW